MKTGVTVTQDKTAQIGKAIAFLAARRVMVGIPADKTARKNDDDSPLNNAQLMAIHEAGAPEVNLPARPVVHPTVKQYQADIKSALGKAGTLALSGNTKGVDRQLNALGLFMQNKLRAKITDGPFVPLSTRTLATRKARGRSGTKPLIDTGQLRRALTYVIRVFGYGGKTVKGK